jgi:hypothetical protein
VNIRDCFEIRINMYLLPVIYLYFFSTPTIAAIWLYFIRGSFFGHTLDDHSGWLWLFSDCGDNMMLHRQPWLYTYKDIHCYIWSSGFGATWKRRYPLGIDSWYPPTHPWSTGWLSIFSDYFVWTSREGPWPWYIIVYTQSFVFCQHISWILGILPLWISARYLYATVTITLSFWRKEAGIHIKDRCSTLPFFYQYSSAYGNLPLRVWSASREVISTSPTVAFW